MADEKTQGAQDAPAEEAGERLEAHEETASQVGRSAALMSVLVVVSRVTGLLRTWGQARALHLTVIGSCYTVANNLPNQLYELVMGGMLVTAFLPVYLSTKAKLGREGSNAYASNLMSLVTLLMGALALLGFVFANALIWTQSFGATEEFDTDLTVYFFRFFAIEIVLYALSSIFSGVLNAERDYLWSNAAPIFNNLVCTASFFLYAALATTQPTLALLCLAIGNPLGVALQVVLQMPSLRRHGIRLTPRVNLHDPAIRETLSIGLPTLVVTFASFATTTAQTNCALSVAVEGSSIAYYTRLFYTLPYAILSIPITTAMFTELSDWVSRDDMDGYVRGLARGSSQIMFLLVPFALYLIVFSRPLIVVLSSGFTSAEVDMTASYLAALAVSLPFYGVCTYLQKACSSLRKMVFYMIATLVASAAQIVCCFAFTQQFGLNVVAWSSLVVFVVNDVMVYWYLKRYLGHIGLRGICLATLRGLGLGLAGAVAGWGLLQGLVAALGAYDGSTVRAFAYVVCSGMVSLVVTFGLAFVLKVPEAAVVRRIATRFLRR